MIRSDLIKLDKMGRFDGAVNWPEMQLPIHTQTLAFEVQSTIYLVKHLLTLMLQS